MNILNFFRSTKFAVILSLILLTTSCSQYDNITNDEKQFDYSLYNEFKSYDLNNIESDDYLNLERISSEIKFQDVINQVNNDLGTDLSFPEEVLELANYDADLIYQTALSKGWISQYEIDLGNQFIEDLTEVKFDVAISNYEQKVINLSLSKEEFSEQEKILNIFKCINDANPDLFDLSSGDVNAKLFSCSWCKCAAASVALIVASANLANCVTVVACGLAIVLVYAASNGFASACLD